MLQRVELYGLAAAIGRTWGNHAFTVLTCRAVAAAVIALATVIEIGRCVVSGAIAYSISETFSVLARLTIGTCIIAGTTVIGIRLEICTDVVAVLLAFGAYTNAIDTIITGCDMCAAMIRGVCFACCVGAIVVKMRIANT